MPRRCVVLVRYRKYCKWCHGQSLLYWCDEHQTEPTTTQHLFCCLSSDKLLLCQFTIAISLSCWSLCWHFGCVSGLLADLFCSHPRCRCAQTTSNNNLPHRHATLPSSTLRPPNNLPVAYPPSSLLPSFLTPSNTRSHALPDFVGKVYSRLWKIDHRYHPEYNASTLYSPHSLRDLTIDSALSRKPKHLSLRNKTHEHQTRSISLIAEGLYWNVLSLRITRSYLSHRIAVDISIVDIPSILVHTSPTQDAHLITSHGSLAPSAGHRRYDRLYHDDHLDRDADEDHHRFQSSRRHLNLRNKLHDRHDHRNRRNILSVREPNEHPSIELHGRSIKSERHVRRRRKRPGYDRCRAAVTYELHDGLAMTGCWPWLFTLPFLGPILAQEWTPTRRHPHSPPHLRTLRCDHLSSFLIISAIIPPQSSMRTSPSFITGLSSLSLLLRKHGTARAIDIHG